ncbi:DEKNAAC100639 [Brettanomyces naardenensis]|uniref:DEKNAAC100639 n=1 Tax=Brettanomyces naardenensis TaxID=13370 RepID=A0A448YGQ3_BRENA|nr:DEKNAAC100639 [Brettanomyces naardenensis]
MGPRLLEILTRTLPTQQAVNELRWIKQELPSDKWEEAVKQRSQQRPLQYILGTQPFGSLTIKCREGVLIPRAETEEWCTRLASCMDGRPHCTNVLDYCTGTGCIALSLASQLSDLGQVVGSDFSQKAVELARENMAFNGQELLESRNEVGFENCDLSRLQVPRSCGKFDLLVSNPPYIPKNDMNVSGGVEESVLKYEPWSALVGDLEFYHYLCSMIPVIGAKAFVFELGYRQQGMETRNLIPDSWKCGLGYDSAGHIRTVIGWCNQELDSLGDMVDEMLA